MAQCGVCLKVIYSLKTCQIAFYQPTVEKSFIADGMGCFRCAEIRRKVRDLK